MHHWLKQKDELQKTKKFTMAVQGPKSGKLPKIKEEVLSYIRDMRNNLLLMRYCN
jgi:hypothetical protein